MAQLGGERGGAGSTTYTAWLPAHGHELPLCLAHAPHVPPQGKLYRDKAAGAVGEGGVALVLGAGNQLPVVALDILYKLVGRAGAWACVVWGKGRLVGGWQAAGT